MEQFVGSNIAGTARNARMTRAGTIGGHEAGRQVANARKRDKVVEGLSTAGGLFGAAYMLDLLKGPSALMRKVGIGKRTGTLRAIGHTAGVLETTSVSDLAKLPGAWMDNASTQYRVVGSTTLADKLGANAVRLDQRMQQVGEALERGYAPVRRGIHGMIDTVAARHETGMMGRMGHRFADWRINANIKRAHGAGQNISELLKGDAIKKHADLSRLGELTARDVKGFSHAALEGHYREIAEETRALLGKGGLPINIANTVMDVARSAKQGVSAVGAAISHAAAKEQGLGAILKNIKLSRMPVLMALVGLGAVATTGAAMLTTKNDNKAGDQVLKDMAELLGGTSHPYLVNVSSAHRSQNSRRWASTGLTAMGEGLFVGTVGTANMGMSMMLAQGALPMLGQVLVKDEPVLNAFANLQQAEKTATPMPKADKVAQVRQLVGAVPAVIPHGGYYNKLCQPIAEAMVEKNLSLRDMMQLLGTPEKFTAFAAEVKAAQEAKHAPQATPEAANDTDADLNTQKPEIAYRHAEAHDRAEREHAAGKPAHAGHRHGAANDDHPLAANDDKPQLRIQADQAQHDGLLTEQQRAVGQNG